MLTSRNLTKNPERKPPSIAVEIILLKASIIITKRKGDKGFPCLRPGKLPKKLDGVLFAKTEKCIEEIQCVLKECHFSPKRHLLNK
jgi:hypothetical protein